MESKNVTEAVIWALRPRKRRRLPRTHTAENKNLFDAMKDALDGKGERGQGLYPPEADHPCLSAITFAVY